VPEVADSEILCANTDGGHALARATGAAAVLTQAADAITASVKSCASYGRALDGEVEVHHTAPDGAKTAARISIKLGAPK
jgi:hypothetical protein